MGSKPDAVPDEDLILTLPTYAEKQATWTASHPSWGVALDLDEYVRREEYLATLPMSRDGGITHWILTTASGTPGERPVLSSAESICKRCLYVASDGSIREGVCHGIGSVFTVPHHRGRGYASKMMGMLGPRLASWQGSVLSESSLKEKNGNGNGNGASSSGEVGAGAGDDGKPPVAFSFLYSDIGKSFYAKAGWPVHEASHLEFKPAPAPSKAAAAVAVSAAAKALTYDDIAELAALDEKIVREKLTRPASYDSSSSKKTRVALLPYHDMYLWHFMREDYMTKRIFGTTPTVRGGLYGEPGRRVWALWTRGYYAGVESTEGNTLYILRLAMEDEEGCDEAYLAEAVGAILGLAREEARDWRVHVVQMWNPSAKLRELVGRTGMEHEYVQREKDSIPSLMWYGEGDIEWVTNEKYGWC